MEKTGINRVDLHVHSNRSDGTFSPKELVDYAMEKHLKAFALTDHDTVEGLGEAVSYARTLREKGIAAPEVVPGIELSSEYHGRDVHIVGLYIDPQKERFRKYLQDFVDSRVERNRKMCRLLSEAGIDITYEKLSGEFPGAVITRAHYAKYLLNHNYINSMQEAFERYVGDHCPYYVPREKVTPVQAVRLILEAGGIPILAHPILYHLSEEHLEELVKELKAAGLLGIEALYSTYSTAEEREVKNLAIKYHLLLSGGSDFHGANKPGLDLAVGYGGLLVPEILLEGIKQCRRNLLFTDLDGTLLRNDGTVGTAMQRELKRATGAGHRLILSSGRPLPSILEVKEHAGLHYPNMFIISNNGALIYDCDRKSPVLELRLESRLITEIVGMAWDAGLHIHGYTENEIVCRGRNRELEYYTRRIHLPLKCVPDIGAALPEGSYKLQCISLDDHGALEHFRSKLLARFGTRIQAFFSNREYLEILPQGADKGKALAFLEQYLPAPHSRTFAAGDAENDISMLKAAAHGIAMKNGEDTVKAVAELVTSKTNDEDGLLEILSKYFEG